MSGRMGEGKRILLCDDDDLLIDLLEYRLGARGFEVLVARDGGEAVALAETEDLDAVVLDAMMPVMDGHQVLRRLRSKVKTATVPVIMLTARRQQEDIVGALDLGANDYLVKPFIPDELIARLTRLLERQK